MDLLIVLALVLLESSVYVDFPYNVVSISVVGYLTSKYELYSLPYAILIGFIMGLSGYQGRKTNNFSYNLFVDNEFSI